MRFYVFSLTLFSQFKFEGFPRTYNLPSKHDLPLVFLNWLSPQLNIHATRNRMNHWIRLKTRFYVFFFALLSRLTFRTFPRTYDLPSKNDLSTAFLNWPSIQLNIHTTENCANTIIIIILQIWEHMESVTMVLYLSCDRIYLVIWRPIYTSTLSLFEWYFFVLLLLNYLIASFDQGILSIEYRI